MSTILTRIFVASQSSGNRPGTSATSGNAMDAAMSTKQSTKVASQSEGLRAPGWQNSEPLAGRTQSPWLAARQTELGH